MAACEYDDGNRDLGKERSCLGCGCSHMRTIDGYAFRSRAALCLLQYCTFPTRPSIKQDILSSTVIRSALKITEIQVSHSRPVGSKWTTSRQFRYDHKRDATRNNLTDISLQGELEKIILNPKYHQPLVLLKAIRNGLVYGVKVRFPHALVMIFLFRSGTIREKLLAIFKATKLHAFNLAKFAFLYKSSMLAMKNVNGKEQSVHPFIAGMFGGYWVFGHGKAAFSSVSQQIVIYVFARVVLGMAKLAVQPPGDNTLVGGAYGGRGGKGIFGLSEEQLAIARTRSWPVFASLSWASVMWLFRWYPEMLQPSLRNSMTYMYVERFLTPLSCLTASERLCDRLATPPTDTGLTSNFSCPDTTTRTRGTAWAISFGTTNDTCTIMTFSIPHCKLAL